MQKQNISFHCFLLAVLYLHKASSSVRYNQMLHFVVFSFTTLLEQHADNHGVTADKTDKHNISTSLSSELVTSFSVTEHLWGGVFSVTNSQARLSVHRQAIITLIVGPAWCQLPYHCERFPSVSSCKSSPLSGDKL